MEITRSIIRCFAALSALLIGLLALITRHVISAPNDPVQSFTPDLGGPQFEARAEEAGQFGVSEQTGSPSYLYKFIVPPGRLGIQPNVALVYSPGSRQIAEGWSLGLPRI